MAKSKKKTKEEVVKKEENIEPWWKDVAIGRLAGPTNVYSKDKKE